LKHFIDIQSKHSYSCYHVFPPNVCVFYDVTILNQKERQINTLQLNVKDIHKLCQFLL